MTFYLRLSGFTQIADLKTAHSDMIAQDENGKDVLGSVYNEDIALHYDNYTPAGPFVMVWFRKDQSLKPLPLGLTRGWQAGGAPVEFYGDS